MVPDTGPNRAVHRPKDKRGMALRGMALSLSESPSLFNTALFRVSFLGGKMGGRDRETEEEGEREGERGG